MDKVEALEVLGCQVRGYDELIAENEAARDAYWGYLDEKLEALDVLYEARARLAEAVEAVK